jgi:hypothetical protein
MTSAVDNRPATAQAETLDQLAEFFRLPALGRDGDGPPDARHPVVIPSTRKELARFFWRYNFNRGVEIGVMEGEFAEVLLAANPQLHYTGVDPYNLRDDYRDQKRNQTVFDNYHRLASKRLAPYKYAALAVSRSMEAVRGVPDRSLDFVYIDGHHNFQNVTNDIVEWSRKVRFGGIIAGHDYYGSKPGAGLHVQLVVDAFTRAYDIKPWFILGAKDGAVGVERDEHRSFLWVNAPGPLDVGR